MKITTCIFVQENLVLVCTLLGMFYDYKPIFWGQMSLSQIVVDKFDLITEPTNFIWSLTMFCWKNFVLNLQSCLCTLKTKITHGHRGVVSLSCNKWFASLRFYFRLLLCSRSLSQPKLLGRQGMRFCARAKILELISLQI